MKILSIPFAFALLAVFVAAPVAAQPATETLDRIVAVVDEDVVLQSELDSQVNSVTTQYASNPAQLPPRDVLERQLLSRLIMQKLQIARAASSGVKVSDADVDQAMSQIAGQNRMDVGQLRTAIEGQGIDFNRFREDVAQQVVVQRLRQGIAQSRVQVSDAEIDSLIRNGKLNAGQIHLGYILVGLPDGATPEQVDEAHAKATEAKQQIDGGMDFTAAAIRYSNAENALQGGDLGWRDRNELPPPLVEAADGLAEGGVSAPIRGPNGFHLIKLIGKREGGGEQLVTEYKARHILTKINELNSDEKAHAKIEALRARIVGGEDFAAVAREGSDDDTTAALGGDLGWFAVDAYGQGVAEAVRALSPGETSPPFRTNVGWHIIKLDEVRNTDKSGDMAREEARNILFQRKAEDEYESFLRQMRSEAYVEVRLPGGETPEPAATP
jgi:peptidyl-prolyl cis-trans isomerase SurA